jgi:hypothetical protein
LCLLWSKPRNVVAAFPVFALLLILLLGELVAPDANVDACLACASDPRRSHNSAVMCAYCYGGTPAATAGCLSCLTSLDASRNNAVLHTWVNYTKDETRPWWACIHCAHMLMARLPKAAKQWWRCLQDMSWPQKELCQLESEERNVLVRVWYYITIM